MKAKPILLSLLIGTALLPPNSFALDPIGPGVPTNATTTAATVNVVVGHDEFVPAQLQVHAGDTVVWTWTTDHISSVTSGLTPNPNGLFDSAVRLMPYTFSYTFTTPGHYDYFCRIDPDNMIGVIDVVAASPPALGNISTRLRVETGDNVLIGGFIITGTQPKKVILRAIAPSLSLPGKLLNPTLELYGPGGLITSNDNWQEAANRQEIVNSTIPPTNDLEAAIVATLPANGTGYTGVVRGLNSTTGIAVIEAYDLDSSANSKLANISTRGLVQTDDNVLIAGMIVVGSPSQKVIVRAIGPSLSLAGKLADPSLELRDGNGLLLDSNDNWMQSANKQAIIDSTVPPTNDLEAAIVRTLAPGNYTAVVRGANNTTGIAVVEAYALN
jgi:plastocyanin